MKKTLATLLASATLAGGLTGCAKEGYMVTKTNYQRSPVTLDTSEFISGDELRRVTHKDSKYELEEVVLNGERYAKIDNPAAKTNELSFALIKYEDLRIRADDTAKALAPESERVYIPTKLLRADGKPVQRAEFSTEGRYAVRAKVTSFDVKDVSRALIYTSQNDFKFNIETITIEGSEFYTPVSEDCEDSTLDFAFIPKDGPIKVFDMKTGAITLDLNGKFAYKPKEVSWADFNSRVPPTPKPKPIPKDQNIGQVEFR